MRSGVEVIITLSSNNTTIDDVLQIEIKLRIFMPKSLVMLCRSALTLAVIVGCLNSAQASLLIYEGFSGYSATTLSGQAVSGSTVGLSGSYATAAASGLTVTSSGLTFGSGATTYAVSGGAASWSVNGAGGAGATLSLSSAYSGTLYGSYLINLGANPTSDGARAEVRMNASTGGATGTSFYNAQAAAITTGNSAVKYNAAIIETPSLLAANTTYMVISRWSNVGGTSGTGTGTVWFLSSAQYDALASAGNLTDAYLDSAVVGADIVQKVTSTTDVYGVSLTSGQALQMIFQSASLNTVRMVDEIKFGSSLYDVSAVPEPTTMAMLMGATMLLVSARKRR